MRSTLVKEARRRLMLNQSENLKCERPVFYGSTTNSYTASNILRNGHKYNNTSLYLFGGCITGDVQLHWTLKVYNRDNNLTVSQSGTTNIVSTTTAVQLLSSPPVSIPTGGKFVITGYCSKTDYLDSDLVTLTLTRVKATLSISASPVSGASFNYWGRVYLTESHGYTDDCVIYYNLTSGSSTPSDPAVPTTSSTLYNSSTGIFISDPYAKINARAFSPNSIYLDSEIMTTPLSYSVVSPTLADPVISLPSGTYEIPQSVTISNPNTGFAGYAKVYYTLDGSTPTVSSPSVISQKTISITETKTLKAVAYYVYNGTVVGHSDLVTREYIINPVAQVVFDGISEEHDYGFTLKGHYHFTDPSKITKVGFVYNYVDSNNYNTIAWFNFSTNQSDGNFEYVYSLKDGTHSALGQSQKIYIWGPSNDVRVTMWQNISRLGAFVEYQTSGIYAQPQFNGKSIAVITDSHTTKFDMIPQSHPERIKAAHDSWIARTNCYNINSGNSMKTDKLYLGLVNLSYMRRSNKNYWGKGTAQGVVFLRHPWSYIGSSNITYADGTTSNNINSGAAYARDLFSWGTSANNISPRSTVYEPNVISSDASNYYAYNSSTSSLREGSVTDNNLKIWQDWGSILNSSYIIISGGHIYHSTQSNQSVAIIDSRAVPGLYGNYYYFTNERYMYNLSVQDYIYIYDLSIKSEVSGNTIESFYRTIYTKTLSKDEWNYLLFTRSTQSGYRFAKARISHSDGTYTNGLIIFSNTAVISSLSLTNCDVTTAPFSSNTISEDNWYNNFQYYGRGVFLPAAGKRDGSTISAENECGYYWSTTSLSTDTTKAYALKFNDSSLLTNVALSKSTGCSVRLAGPATFATQLIDVS